MRWNHIKSFFEFTSEYRQENESVQKPQHQSHFKQTIDSELLKNPGDQVAKYVTFGASPKVVNELLNIKEERKDGILILTKMGHLVALVWQSYHD